MALRNEDRPADLSGGNVQWSGLDELAQTPEFVEMLHREFPEDATAWTDPVSRRQFLTLAGASIALAGIGCSPRPVAPEKIYPYARTQPEQITLGLPLFFATGYTQSGVTTGVLVKSREGRPIKIEGNPTHPGSLGAADVFMQASILNMFDPDRSRGVLRKGIESTFDGAVSELRAACEALRVEGKTVRVLTETIGSPTLGAVLARFLKQFPKGEWVQYEPLNRDNVVEGAKLAYGEPVNTIYDFSKALRVVSLDADFLSSGPGSVRYAKDFNSLREVRTHQHKHKDKDGHEHVETHAPHDDDMNRLYAFESMLTPTGSVADHHYAVRSVEIDTIARALAKAVGVSVSDGGKLPEGVTDKVIAAIAKDLLAFKGKCIVIAGDHQSAAVHVLAANMNAVLGNIGKTVLLTTPTEVKPTNQTAEFKKLVDEMKAGAVDALFIVGGNPVYTAPVDLDFKGALAKVRLKVHVGQRLDETGILCDWHINETHYLESWGDGRGYDGTATICQPLMAPLYEAHSPLEFFAMLTGLERSAQSPRELVKEYWSKNWPKAAGEFSEIAWEKALQAGVIPSSASAAVAKVPNANAIPAAKPVSGGVELNFRADPTLYDGSFANNGWMLELPKPITKLTWDNAIIISPKMAAKSGIRGIAELMESTGGGEHGRAVVDMGALTIGKLTIKAAVWIQPGHADDSITFYVGSGRERAGKVGNKTGFNAYTMRTSDNPWTVVGADLKRAGETYILACTQSHHQMEGRRPVRYATLAEFNANLKAHDEKGAALFAKVPKVAAPHWQAIDETLPGNERRDTHTHGHDDGKHKHDHRVTPLTLYPDTNKVGRRWAMAIDLTKCNGCGVCELACQAENNIPVVGKTQVNKGREMHWIRVDRYFEGKDPADSANLTVHFQPVPCQQCEKAPCEVVCPVAATIHSADGLNDMVYNRCVGTRYCSNNCPYKVRRFNFLTFADFKTEQFKLMNNPEVTVRERGVMEKCTYCVQRIRAAEIEAERRGVVTGDSQIKDGEIVTACQAACPASAIIFGDLNDPKAQVNEWKSQPTNYGLLAELNTMPRTTYLATIRNPNPELTKGA